MGLGEENTLSKKTECASVSDGNRQGDTLWDYRCDLGAQGRFEEGGSRAVRVLSLSL